MPLTREEKLVRVEKFGGQRGRDPVGSLSPGNGSFVDGASLTADRISRQRGSVKLTSSQIPPSGYELAGVSSGILEIPCVEGFDAAWQNTFGTAGVGWGLSFAFLPLDAGDFSDTIEQVFFSTATEIGTHPAGGADINSVRLSFVTVAGVWTLKARWGITTYTLSMQSDTAQNFDPSVLTWFRVSMRAAVSDTTLSIGFSQVHPTLGFINKTSDLHTEAKGWVAHQFWIGGTLPARFPLFGVTSPCHGIVSEVVLRANNAASIASLTEVYLGPWTRYPTTPPDAPSLYDVWHLTDSTAQPLSANGRQALLVGNDVRRDTGITTKQPASVRFDGSGMLILRDASILRESPKPSASGGVDNTYLELPAWSLVMAIDPRHLPWRHPSVERAVLACWSTPYAVNLGVPSDPMLGTWPTSVRPSEHLRVEIEHIGTAYYLRVYFGELEPTSLKHPTGTLGGSSSTAFPPALDAAGEPPVSWNKPQGDPTALYSTANGKSAFQVLLGDTGVAGTHPMDYGWWIFIERKFVAQGDPGNACGVFVRRIKVDGTPDTGYGEHDDFNADANGERHPANQSCYTAARLGTTPLNYQSSNYVLSLGAAIGSQFGDEKLSYDATNRYASILPLNGADTPIALTDQIDAFPFCGRMASIAFLKRYLSANDRASIANAGQFGSAQRALFNRDLLLSINADEEGGNVLRDARGNDIAYVDKVAVTRVQNDATVFTPSVVGCFPRPQPPWNNEITVFPNEFSSISGLVQRIDAGGHEEIFVTAPTGLYLFSRTDHSLTRIATLPGQGGAGPLSVVVDNNDVVWIAGGIGRPILITREQVIATGGIDNPVYAAPADILTSGQAIAGGPTFAISSKTDTNPANLVGFNIDDGATVQFAIGFWSGVLKARSAPGPTVTVKATAGAIPDINTKYRLLVSNLPAPTGPNADLVTHWEIYRTDSNGSVLLLEHLIPIGSASPSSFVGDLGPAALGVSADFFRDVPHEGMRAIVPFGDRLVGVGVPEFPRAIVWTKRADSMNWPSLYYSANLNQTSSPSVGVIVRRDRAFAFSRDYIYQMLDKGIDADPLSGQFSSIDVQPLVDGMGCISHFAAVTDHENGIYLPGNKTIALTEGGMFRSVSIANDSSAGLDGEDFAWPDSWDLGLQDQFVTFHDERHRVIGVVGPSTEDPKRRDVFLMYYEDQEVTAPDKTMVSNYLWHYTEIKSARMKGLDMRCLTLAVNPDSGLKEVLYGSSFGYLLKLGDLISVGVDYDWLPSVDPKMGIVMAVPSTTTLRLDASYSGYPTSDLFRGARAWVYRDDVLISEGNVIQATVYPSWVDVTLDVAHAAEIGDTWVIGSAELRWVSGKLDFGTLLQDKAVQSADLTLVDSKEN